MHGGRTPANRLVDPDIQPWFTAYILVDPDIQPWFTAYIFGMGSQFMLWSIDTCQSEVSTDQHHVTMSRAQV